MAEISDFLSEDEMYVNLVESIWGTGIIGDNSVANMNNNAKAIIDTVFRSIIVCIANLSFLSASLIVQSINNIINSLPIPKTIKTLLDFIIDDIIHTGLPDGENNLYTFPSTLTAYWLNYIRSNNFAPCITNTALTWKSALAAALAGIDIKLVPTELQSLSELKCELSDPPLP
jgi:hypothetical protein